MWLDNRFKTKNDLAILFAILVAGYTQFYFTKNYVLDCFSSTYLTLQIALIFIFAFGMLLLTTYLFGKLGASSAYFERNGMYVGRIPIGASLYLLIYSAGLLFIFMLLVFEDLNNWDLRGLTGVALVLLLAVGIPTYSVFATFFCELSWNSTEINNNSISLRRNKQRHFYFKDISEVIYDTNRTKVIFNDGSHLVISPYMGGYKDLLSAMDPYHN